MPAEMESLLHTWFAAWMHFVLNWGYAGIFLMMAFESTALPIPAEIVIPPAAYWAAQGKLNLWGVIIAATLGSYTGSAISYWVAWKVGRPLFEKYGRFLMLSPAKIASADEWFASYGAGGVFVARLLPAIRHVISIPAGLFHMNFKKFSLMTILGAGIFCTALAFFGREVLGGNPALMQDPALMVAQLKAKSVWIIGFAVVIGLLYGIMTWMQRRAAQAARRAD